MFRSDAKTKARYQEKAKKAKLYYCKEMEKFRRDYPKYVKYVNDQPQEQQEFLLPDLSQV